MIHGPVAGHQVDEEPGKGDRDGGIVAQPAVDENAADAIDHGDHHGGHEDGWESKRERGDAEQFETEGDLPKEEGLLMEPDVSVRPERRVVLFHHPFLV